MRLSIVATLYRYERYLEEFYPWIYVVAQSLPGDDFEIFLVDDVSPDDYLTLALELQARDRCIQASDLLRNFGHPRPRAHQSSYTLSRKLILVVDSIYSFRIAPLSLIFFIGLLIWFGSVLFGLSLLIWKLLEPEMVLTGLTSILLSIWFLGGSFILVLGLLGMYIGKVFQEVKCQPPYII